MDELRPGRRRSRHAHAFDDDFLRFMVDHMKDDERMDDVGRETFTQFFTLPSGLRKNREDFK